MVLLVVVFTIIFIFSLGKWATNKLKERKNNNLILEMIEKDGKSVNN